MIYKALAEIILAASLVQIFPVDAGVVESYSKLPTAASRYSVNISELVKMAYPTFPIAENINLPPKKIRPESMGVVTAAASALVQDAKSGAVLYEKNAAEPRSIGSVTKLMTALVFLSANPDLNQEVFLVSEDLREGGRQHVPINKIITVKDLLLASLVSSDNSATAAIARLSGLSENDFVAKMNQKAIEIGMTETNFSDPTGLSSENRATAHDVVALLHTALENENIRLATEQAATTITDKDGSVYQLENTNELLIGFINQNPYKIVGGKTGYLPEAGYCLGVQMEKDSGKDIFVVVLGSDSLAGRLNDVKALTVWAYQTYEW